MKRTTPPKSFTARFKFVVILLGLLVAGLSETKLSKSPTVELASTPTDLSLKSGKDAILKTKDAIGNKNLSALASGIAYGGTLAFFPLVIACVAIASTVISDQQINTVVESISSFLPSDMAGLLTAQLTNAMDSESANILIAAVAIGFALFGVSGAMNSLVNGLNVAYQSDEG